MEPRPKWYADPRWQYVQLWFTVIMGGLILLVGIGRTDAAMMTVGGGLIGFSPIARGPCPKVKEA